MMKKIAIALLCTTLGATLYAREDISTSKLFVGLEIQGTTVNSSNEYIFTDANYEEVASLAKLNSTGDTLIEYGIRLGAEKEDWRTTLLYTYSSDENDGLDETMHKGSILLDYFVVNWGSNSFSAKPYIGAHVGYMSYSASIDIPEYGVSQVLMDDTGLFYGGQVGIAMTIKEVVQLDLSYKYSLTSIESTNTLENFGNGYWLDDVYGIDNMGTIAFSVNYFY